ncbi:ABC transporter substrate-binding protein [Ponticoccus sp. SC2-23]|uniref:ABC transporter substrate-binding protein n=1 Tax=Alexandriicola marinus TaxID=2081710 RepID=UPI000FDC4198|nr:ABC transporter substrate-binding protein [Alexandriicola marinus]MBM1220000.1 ABC transporter substrate-binding protein [Ponticoccus sp. SC6-9]MBM1224686.1 ABC transporter substrate-binding protein [Ponticoccus sp. SC6-15]MBM1228199.1 ABC transporter substrate-binding protein [Ponticoccus sp. SC6-38]MBM1234163.1 ABC transporter substrate-binding protein [Ponticoccus sp. SC6-45]MBM1238701.1 ABC transporter substrate-binding protein [Ponticoccus sp. SC6-49]MBM1242482.1 ABC transporter subst
MKRLLLAGTAMLVLPTAALANCPAITMADMQGIEPGAYPQQYELSAFEAAAGCDMEFSTNPAIADLNAQIVGNPELPPLAERLPAEPLVVVPYDSVGQYGGVFDALSNATEAGTSDFLSVRHVNLVRYADDLQTIVPNIAKSWEWNDDFTQLTFHLREGHKWSDGAPFTSADVAFWHDNLMLDTNIYESPRDYVLVGGEPMTVETPDETTVIFNLPAPKPGLLTHFATSYAPGFQPQHFLGQFHPDINPDADAYAQSLGFENGYDAILAYYGNSDWTDTPTPMLSRPEIVDGLPKATMPTLESHIYITDTTEGRRLVANPYFHQVDTTGQQLPYISEQNEVYINDNEVRILSLVNGDVDYKSQSVRLDQAPLLLENQESGNYTIQLKPTVGMPAVSFNFTVEDEAKREVFQNLDFRIAMSVAINRDELNEVAYFGQGTPSQILPFNPVPEFVDPQWASFAAEYDPTRANELLDSIGMADTDGDGFRELPNGDRMTLALNYSTQGISGSVVELISQYWAEVGIQSVVKEVTPDEYRSAQSANQLDVALWQYGAPLAIHMGLNTFFRVPFGTYFEHRTGMLWAEWMDSNGEQGIEPPEWVKTIAADIDAFQSATPGSAEQNELGARLVATFTENLPIIGTVQAPEPIYVSNRLNNVPEFKTWSYEYYRTYPYRATQWWLSE